MPNRWLKLYGYEWLKGSIHFDLDVSERGVWADLLALASLSRRPGFIEHSEGIPYTLEDIAKELANTPVDIILSTIKKCMQEGRLSKDGLTFFITNWEKYQSIPDDKKSPDKMDARDRELYERQQTRKFTRKRPDEAMDVLQDDINKMIQHADEKTK